MGLKMIPPGIHFIYVSVKNAPRIGFFYNFKQQEIVAKKWDEAIEDFNEYQFNENEVCFFLAFIFYTTY